MKSSFYTNYSEQRFIDKLKQSIDTCKAFYFSVSFIRKPGLLLLSGNIESALNRGAKGYLITSTYQNFTDIDSLAYFLNLSNKYPNNFFCHLEKDSFADGSGNIKGFHSKGYLFEFAYHNELLIGSSNITIYALLKNIEWDVSVIDDENGRTFIDAKKEFDYLWEHTNKLNNEMIDDYKTHLYYAVDRWDMDYDIANSDIKPNYMQRRALRELNRLRVMGATKALVIASAGSGKTYMAAFDALNYNPKKLLYIAPEGTILNKSYDTFQRVFGSDRNYGLYTGEFKDPNKDFVFATNITMANSIELFDKHHWDYIIIDECHHATAETYRKIIDYYEPGFLLGITATPERMDGEDVFELFDQNVPYELRLRDAITNGIVVPFKYWGIRDELIDYGLKETKDYRFVEQFSDETHCEFIRNMIEHHRIPGQKLKAIAFCRDRSHAVRMSQAMGEYYETAYLTGRNSSGERHRAFQDLQSDNTGLEILFTVDILNEGVDIPAVNMVLFLRPTESQTIFIQQLGRGLRKYEGKDHVEVLDLIGNDYRRSVQIAFALGNLSENFVTEKRLIKALIDDDFKSIGLEEYGVEIHLDDLSKKEILEYIDEENFNTKKYLETDYNNFKKYISCETYPKHVDYLNNDFAPDLIKFLQSKINGKKNGSYYGFLKAISEENLPVFDKTQEEFIRDISEMLPIVRPYEYLIIQKLIYSAGKETRDKLKDYVQLNTNAFEQDSFDHALYYMLQKDFFSEESGMINLNVSLDVEMEEYMKDLLDYGLGKYDIDFSGQKEGQKFLLWKPYRKKQIQQLLLKNPGDNMKGTKIYDGVVYAYVTIIKSDKTTDNLKYEDGYIDKNTFQWETVANVKDIELAKLKSSKEIHLFVRKVENEDGITLPFTYIGYGHMEFIEGSKKDNGAYLFRIPMEETAPEDIFFDFKLPNKYVCES